MGRIHVFQSTHVLSIPNACNWPNKHSGRWGIPCRMYMYWLLSTYCYINPQFGLRFWHFLIGESCSCAPWLSHRSRLQKSQHSRGQHMPGWACNKRDFQDDVFIFFEAADCVEYCRIICKIRTYTVSWQWVIGMIFPEISGKTCFDSLGY